MFLGFHVSANGIKPLDENVNKVVEWLTPQNPTDVRAFLGLSKYYSRFIQHYSQKAQPLICLTRQDVPFHWTEDCQKAFDQLKQELTSSSIMAHPQADGLMILDTDVSKDTIGCVLSQVQDGVERVISYGSRTLSHSERNLCTADGELLAPKYFMEHYRQYLLGRHFLLRTDHASLVWLFSLKEPCDKIAQWLMVLNSYEFTIEYHPGKKHGNANAMSRQRCENPVDCQCPVMEEDEQVLPCGPCKKCKR